LLALALFEERLRMRPHAANLLLEAAFLLPLAAGSWRASPTRWRLAALLVSGLWSFLHAMAVFWLLAVIASFVVLGKDAAERRRALAMLALSSLGVALAPGALGGIAHVVAIASDWAPFVPELRPSWAWFELGTPLAAVSGVVPWLATLAVLAAFASRPPPERRAPLASALGLAAGSVAMVRLGYYAAFALALAAPELGPLTARFGRNARRLAVLSAVALGALLVLHVAPRWRVAFPWTTTLHPGAFPVAEARALRDAGAGGRIWNETEWGGYLLWALHPPSTVLSDGRVTFTPDVADLLRRDERPSERPALAEEAFRRYGIDLLVRRKGVFPGHPDWELLLRGPVADVWSRKGPVTDRRKEALAGVLGRRPQAASPPGP
jgi:hypothetical protein